MPICRQTFTSLKETCYAKVHIRKHVMPRCMQTLTSLKDMLCKGVYKETCYAKMYADIDITKGNMLCQGVYVRKHVMPRCITSLKHGVPRCTTPLKETGYANMSAKINSHHPCGSCWLPRGRCCTSTTRAAAGACTAAHWRTRAWRTCARSGTCTAPPSCSTGCW